MKDQKESLDKEVLWKEIARYYLQDHPDQLCFDFLKNSGYLKDEQEQLLLFADGISKDG